jgi:hypothetical protein
MNDSRIEDKSREPDEFEQQLKRSLRRIDAPRAFVTRVLERAAVSEKPLPARRRVPRLPFQASVGAAALILALSALVTYQVHVRGKRAQVAQIQAQFDTAMRITDHALAQTRAELERTGLTLGE